VLQFVKTNTSAVNLVLLTLILSLCALYIVQVNSAVAKGFQIRELETSIHQLTVDSRELEVAAREAQSLQNISSSIKMMGLVSAETPTYVSGSAPSYALAD